MNQGGYPDGMSQREHDEAFKDAEEVKTIPISELTDRRNRSPVLKQVFEDMNTVFSMDDLFSRTEGHQEAGKFGIKPKRSDEYEHEH